MSIKRTALLLLALLAATALLVGPANAQSLQLDLGTEDGSLTFRAVQLFVLITILSLAPGIAMMVTCFPFMVTVLSILRQAIGLQQAPPNMLIVTLALFLTYFVMEPVFTEAWLGGVQPLLEDSIDETMALERIAAPFTEFMMNRVSPTTLNAMIDVAPAREGGIDPASPPLSVLLPSFLLSEIQRGFEIGFMIFLPFLVIDIVIASVLMSMGMMMVPPVVVSLPFKLAFFVMADGWTLLAGALVRGYAGG